MIVTDPAFVRAQEEAARLEQIKPGKPGIVSVKRPGDYVIHYPEQLPGLWRYLRIRDLMATGMKRKSALARTRREWKHEPWLLKVPA